MVSIRLRLSAGLLSVMLLFLLPGTYAQTVTEQQSVTEQQLTDTVQIAVDKLPVFFSPYAASPLELQYAHLFFDPLVRWERKPQVEKRLVRDWQIVSRKVMRFYLKKGITFHSGNELNSRDITWTFSQIVKEPRTRRLFSGISSIKVVDRYSFDVHSLLSPGQILDYFSHFFVMDARFYQQHAIDTNTSHEAVTVGHNKLLVSGTGPYKIKEYNPALHLHVVSNKTYWQGEAALPELNFIKIQSADSRTFALLADDIDISESVSNQMLDTLRFIDSKRVVELPCANLFFLTINQQKSNILQQKAIREAINLAINKQGMLKHIIHGMGKIAAIYTPLRQTEASLPVYDLAKAKSIFSKVKVPLELTLLVLSEQAEQMPEIVEALVNMMKRLGIKLLVTVVDDREVWSKNLFAYDFSLSVWHSTLMNSENIYHALFADSILSGYFSSIFQEQKLAGSVDKQAVFFTRMQQRYQIIPLLFHNQIWAADNRYNLPAIFSMNGVPYWHLLTENAF
jgi:peptide/nickel transport system substrate-binding protein